MTEPLKPFTRKIKVRAVLIVTSNEWAIYGDDDDNDAPYRKMIIKGLWDQGDEHPSLQATVDVEFEIEVSSPAVTVVAVKNAKASELGETAAREIAGSTSAE